MKTKIKVKKGLTPEEKTLIGNLKAMIQELEALGGGTAQGATPVIESEVAGELRQEVVPNEEEENTMKPEQESGQQTKKPPFPVKKAANTGQGVTDTEVPAANDDAEERIEELPPDDAKQVDEVSKALATLLGKRPTVQATKSADAQLAEVLKGIVEEQRVIKEAMVGLLKNLGLAEQVTRAYEQDHPVQKDDRKPVYGLDNEQVADMVVKSLAKVLGKTQDTSDPSKTLMEVRKDLGQVLGAFAQDWAFGRPQR